VNDAVLQSLLNAKYTRLQIRFNRYRLPSITLARSIRMRNKKNKKKYFIRIEQDN
jgi:hypothetical protein